MKTLLITIFTLITATAFAQKDTVGLNIPYADGVVVYERVFEATGVSKAALYDNSLLWLTQRYKGDRYLEISDTATARVTGKGREIVNFTGPLNHLMPFEGLFTIQIDCKDNRYRCRIYNIILSTDEGNKSDRTIITPEELVATLTGKPEGVLNKNQARRMLESLNTTINDTMASLYKTMADKNDF
jgi:hypothetical protein